MVLQDIRYALRLLRKNPGFAATAILTLALGIGTNSVIFSVLNAVVLRPLPYHDPGKLVWITETSPGAADQNVSWLDFQDWKAAQQVFSGVAGYRDAGLNLTGVSSPQRVNGRYVTADYFSVLGVHAETGRTFLPQEHKVGGPQLVVLSHEFWQSRLGGDAAIIGRRLQIDGKSFEVTGIMPRAFGSVTHTDVWLPFEQNVPAPYLSNRGISWLFYVVGRIKPEVSFEQTRKEMERISSQIAAQYPKTNASTRTYVLPLTTRITGDSRPVLVLLTMAVALILLIASGNLASLLLARMTGRQRELSLRLALGAARKRLIAQLMTESLILGLAGGALGLLFASLGNGLALQWVPRSFPINGNISIDARVLIFTMLVSVATGALIGLAPAISTWKSEPQLALKAQSRSVAGGWSRLHAFVIIGEVALAVTVLVAAGLMIRSLRELFRVDPGFDSRQVLTASITLPVASYPKQQDRHRLLVNALEKIQEVPGVDSAAAVFPVPFTPQIYEVWLAVEGRVPKTGEEQVASVSVVTKDYFHVMRIPLRRGRVFDGRDDLPKMSTVIIDQNVADKYWPGQDPIGRQLKMGTQDFSDLSAPAMTIVGVVAPVRADGLDATSKGKIYVSADQQTSTSTTFVVRTLAAPQLIAGNIEAAIASVDPNIPVFQVQTMTQAIEQSQATRRMTMILLACFAAIAILLAGLGLYGVMSYMTGKRTSEIGLRLALGALPQDVLRMLLKQGLRWVLGGILAGVGGALLLSRLMSTLLFGVRNSDPLAFLMAIIVLAGVALASCYFPARRAIRVDPMVALRDE